MKSENKILKYLLFVLVVMVWGIIIYRVLASTGNTTKKPFVITHARSMDKMEVIDSFSLLLDYPDPFIPEVDSTALERISAKQSALRVADKPPDFSFIKYSGLIVGGRKKNKFAMINFREKDLILKEKNSVDGFKLIKIFKDSVKFNFNGNVVVVKKSD